MAEDDRTTDQIAQQIAVLDDATERLAAAVQAARDLGPDAFGQPSRLPDWTIGHVVSHLARNADAQRNLLRWATSGEVTPAYASPQARVADIEAGAARDTDEIAEDFAASLVRAGRGDRRHAGRRLAGHGRHRARGADAGRRRARRSGSPRWNCTTTTSAWTTGSRCSTTTRRAALLAAVVRSYVRTRDVPDLTLRPRDREPVVLGAGGQEIAGRAADLAAWLAGRSDGAALTSDGAAARSCRPGEVPGSRRRGPARLR